MSKENDLTSRSVRLSSVLAAQASLVDLRKGFGKGSQISFEIGLGSDPRQQGGCRASVRAKKESESSLVLKPYQTNPIIIRH